MRSYCATIFASIKRPKKCFQVCGCLLVCCTRGYCLLHVPTTNLNPMSTPLVQLHGWTWRRDMCHRVWIHYIMTLALCVCFVCKFFNLCHVTCARQSPLLNVVTCFLISVISDGYFFDLMFRSMTRWPTVLCNQSCFVVFCFVTDDWLACDQVLKMAQWNDFFDHIYELCLKHVKDPAAFMASLAGILLQRLVKSINFSKPLTPESVGFLRGFIDCLVTNAGKTGDGQPHFDALEGLACFINFGSAPGKWRRFRVSVAFVAPHAAQRWNYFQTLSALTFRNFQNWSDVTLMLVLANLNLKFKKFKFCCFWFSGLKWMVRQLGQVTQVLFKLQGR